MKSDIEKKDDMKKIIYLNLDLLFEKLEQLNEEEEDLKKEQDFVLLNLSKLTNSGGFSTKREEK